MSFEGKVVIETGASSGIGAAMAEAFSAEGARVVMVGRNQAKLDVVAEHCDRPLVVKADITNEDDVRLIMDQTIPHFGKLDILINNAGIVYPENIFDKNILKAFDSVIGINLRALVHLTSFAASHLIETKGNIINMSSIGGEMVPRPESGLSIYCTSKAALNHFGSCIAAELAPHGVRVSTISLGPVKTDIFNGYSVNILIYIKNVCFLLKSCFFVESDFILYLANFLIKMCANVKKTALKRVSERKEIADLVLFLTSDKAEAETGSNYVTDNGTILFRST